jgi:predicted RNase H-like HicB family nuclease
MQVVTRDGLAVIVFEAEEGGYWTRVPELPGAGSQGETVDEALENTSEAIALMLEYLAERRHA